MRYFEKTRRLSLRQHVAVIVVARQTTMFIYLLDMSVFKCNLTMVLNRLILFVVECSLHLLCHCHCYRFCAAVCFV